MVKIPEISPRVCICVCVPRKNKNYHPIMSVCSLCVVRDHRGRHHMVAGFTTTFDISAYHQSRQFEFRSRRGVLDTRLCDNVCQ